MYATRNRGSRFPRAVAAHQRRDMNRRVPRLGGAPENIHIQPRPSFVHCTHQRWPTMSRLWSGPALRKASASTSGLLGTAVGAYTNQQGPNNRHTRFRVYVEVSEDRTTAKVGGGTSQGLAEGFGGVWLDHALVRTYYRLSFQGVRLQPTGSFFYC